MSTEAPLIEFREASKRFRDDAVPVLDEVSLSVQRGELVALIGPSGCGKSTLLSIAAGLIPLTSGEIAVSDRKLVLAYVFQHPRLLPWRTVRRNIEFSLDQTDQSSQSKHAAADRVIKLVHLEEHQHKYPHQLSGGMQQRVALARGLAIDPDVLLLDEPLGALDALTRSYLQEELLGIVRTTGTTTLLVTHDIDEALLLADRILVMSTRPGRIKREIDVPFGADRSLETLIQDDRYGPLRGELRRLLRPEAVVAEEENNADAS